MLNCALRLYVVALAEHSKPTLHVQQRLERPGCELAVYFQLKAMMMMMMINVKAFVPVIYFLSDKPGRGTTATVPLQQNRK
jgi:hypothetical protein